MRCSNCESWDMCFDEKPPYNMCKSTCPLMDTSSDTISRQAAIDIICDSECHRNHRDCNIHAGSCFTVERIADLPSVIPSRPKGHWIDEGSYADGNDAHVYRCSECGGRIVEYESDAYCKYCGAKMESEGVKKDCTTCILDGTDACVSGASDDDVCEGYIAESEE